MPKPVFFKKSKANQVAFLGAFLEEKYWLPVHLKTSPVSF